MISCFLCGTLKPFQKGSTHEGENLLLEKKIFSCKGLPPWRRKARNKIELLFLKVCPFTLNCFRAPDKKE